MKSTVDLSSLNFTGQELKNMNTTDRNFPEMLDGLILVEAGIDEDGTVDIYTIKKGKIVLVESGGEAFARAWLGKLAQRLIGWNPRSLKDELSGIWVKPGQRD
jgi:hypothetical protein